MNTFFRLYICQRLVVLGFYKDIIILSKINIIILYIPIIYYILAYIFQ